MTTRDYALADGALLRVVEQLASKGVTTCPVASPNFICRVLRKTSARDFSTLSDAEILARIKALVAAGLLTFNDVAPRGRNNQPRRGFLLPSQVRK